ncbi:cysteine hydrolase [Rhodococcus sp. NPDC056960]|uniref:cysteine hydrolase n=1 Tax=Rhodococcus sp. NPDC056960 TaxID=3345982 RepID=UPI00363B0AA5
MTERRFPYPLDPSRTALINVHWQEDIVTPTGAFAPFFAESVARHHIIDTTRILLDGVRSAGAHVIWTRAAFAPGYPELILNTALNRAIADMGALVEGSHGARIIPDLEPLPTEAIISHPGTSAFSTSPLDSILRRHRIDTVLFTGVATNVTVEGTARDAVNLGYNTIIVTDACAAATDAAHQATLDTFELLGHCATTDEVLHNLTESEPQTVGAPA